VLEIFSMDFLHVFLASLTPNNFVAVPKTNSLAVH
jgi:hypothetical protein